MMMIKYSKTGFNRKSITKKTLLTVVERLTDIIMFEISLKKQILVRF